MSTRRDTFTKRCYAGAVGVLSAAAVDGIWAGVALTVVTISACNLVAFVASELVDR